MGGDKKKLPNVPKKPPGPYLEFTKEERKKVREDLGPSASVVEVGRELGRRWKNLPLAEKETFQKRSKENVAKYEAEKKEWNGRLPPKKPLSPYLEFVEVERAVILAEVGTISFSELGKELGRRWKNLPEIEKEVFKIKGKENWTVYSEELSKFQQETNVAALASSGTTAHGDQGPGDVAEAAPKQLLEPVAAPSAVPVAADLGFAKQRFFPWHPALKTGELARGSRITVTYFGTAENGTVDKDKWVSYSEQSVARICSPYLMKKTSFKKGLEQMKVMLDKINTGRGEEILGRGVGFVEQPVGRKLVKLSKDGLMKDEEMNLRLMKDKVVEVKDGKFKYACQDCNWRGKYLNRAKAHARDCGSRRRENKKRPRSTQYECSAEGCSLAFSKLKQLQNHYRLSHFKAQEGGYKCLPCKQVFSLWRTFKRHRELKHGDHPSSYVCSYCSYKTSRKDNLSRHTKLVHGVDVFVSRILDKIIEEVIAGKDGDDGKEDFEPAAETVGVISEYEKIRNARVAEIDEEFRRLFPEIKKKRTPVLKTRKKKAEDRRKKAVPVASMTRRSLRCASVVDIDVVEVPTTSQSEDGVLEIVVEENPDMPMAGGDHGQPIGTDELDGGVVVPSELGKHGCIPCNMAFKRSAHLKRHVDLVHKERSRPVICPRTWCAAQFSSVFEMIKHKQTCLLLCPYPDCQKSFKREALFSAHQRNHLAQTKRMSD